MDCCHYQEEILHIEECALAEIAADCGTPCYVYSEQQIKTNFESFNQPLQKAQTPYLICYAVKANSNLAVLRLLAELGAGFDIVSAGELYRVILAGGNPSKVVFSGVGKREDEMRYALEQGIRCFNVESHQELLRLHQLAKNLDIKAPVSLRINPDINPNTHPYISTGLKENKFGIAIENAKRIYQEARTMQHIELVGIDCHIGSQITSIEPFSTAIQQILALVDELVESGINLQHIDVGGGIGICYRDEIPPLPEHYVKMLHKLLHKRSLEIIIEPGRSIVGNAGVLLTKVEYIHATPHKRFAIVDAAMNDLLRPALYQSWHDIKPVARYQDVTAFRYDIVGPVCEAADFIANDRLLQLQQGDLLAVLSAGAYGFSMSSNYNSRLRASEIMVKGKKHRIVRRREQIADLVLHERN